MITNHQSSPLVDIGLNLTNDRFKKDRDVLLDRAKASFVHAAIITGTNVKSSQMAVKLCQSLSTPHGVKLYSTAGR